MADMWLVEAVARVGVAVLSIFLFVVIAVAYRRRPSPRMRLVLMAFGIFLLEGLILLYEVFIRDTSLTEATYYGFQFLELLVLAAAVLRR